MACLISIAPAAPVNAEALAERAPEIELAPDTVLLGTEAVAEVQTTGQRTVVHLKEGKEEPELKDSVPLVLPPAYDEEDPKGAFGEVLQIGKDPEGRTTIVLGPEELSAAYKKFELDVKDETIDELEEEAGREAAESTGEPNPLGPNPLDHLTRLLRCSGKVQPEAKLGMGLGKLKPHLIVSLKQKRFYFDLKGTPEFTGTFKAAGSAECDPAYLPKLSVPLFHAPPVFLEIGPVAAAKLEGSIDTRFKWTPKITVGAQRKVAGETRPIWKLEDARPDTPRLEAGGSVTMDLGLSVGVSLAKSVAVSGRFGPSLKIEHHLLPEPACSKDTVAGFAELSGHVDLFVRRWRVSLTRTDFRKREFPKGAECPRGVESARVSRPGARSALIAQIRLSPLP